MNEQIKELIKAIDCLLNNASKTENRVGNSTITAQGNFTGYFTCFGKDLTAVQKSKKELENVIRSG